MMQKVSYSFHPRKGCDTEAAEYIFQKEELVAVTEEKVSRVLTHSLLSPLITIMEKLMSKSNSVRKQRRKYNYKRDKSIVSR